ncbi:CLUMA_CG002768, isoform A [Clunio marinus]|uniref:CLUMA_CG002768, isoform A n=1 Tax=Clunio marinus TaxID=568069 RepID=A0A1J1HL42_9DIPT|nr:CLUMA_CG002768, isoform A [Clunio marinus]
MQTIMKTEQSQLVNKAYKRFRRYMHNQHSHFTIHNENSANLCETFLLFPKENLFNALIEL